MPKSGFTFQSKIISLVLVFAWAGLLFYLHIIPGEDLRLDTWWFKYHMDKWAHAFMFMILFMLLVNFFRRSSVLRIRRYLYAGLVVAVFGALMETMQGTLIVGRVADPLDFLADCAGIFFGMITFRIFYLFGWWS